MIQNSYYNEEWDQDINVEYTITDIEFDGEICRFRLVFNDKVNDDKVFVLDSGGLFHGKGALARTEKNINRVFRDEIREFLEEEYTIPESDRLELISQRKDEMSDYEFYKMKL